MNFYYGLVDEATNAWGFVEETDPRVHEDMIFLTEAQWRALLKGQSQGQQIAYYEGKVFNAEQGRYYLEKDGWHRKTDEEWNTEKANKKKENLINQLYEIKSNRAYNGIIINDTLVFETNSTAITNTVASLALMDDTASASWKFYTVDGLPKVQKISKAQLAYIAQFGNSMINQCFEIEGTFNDEIEEATQENLLDDTWAEDFIQRATEAMDAVENKITIELGA